MPLTLSGITTLVRLLHPSNAYEPMLVTLLGIVTAKSLEQPDNILFSILAIESGNDMLVIAQFANAEAPMFVTEPGIVTLFKEVQLQNALSPTLVTPSGITTVRNLALDNPDGTTDAVR